jgi:Spy/CpxP family protein refolding chaperone
LANINEVQDALKLSDEQKEKLDELNDDLRAARRELRDQQADRAEYRKLDEETSAKLAEALDETQNKRLLGILAQVSVDAALNNATIAKDLNITDDQKKALADARESNREAMRSAFEAQGQDVSREQRMAKFNELRAAADKKLLAALTSEQQAQFDELKGDPVKIEMRQFGGGRGGRGEGRGDRAGRGERRRDRDRDGDEGDAESNSADRGA